MQQQSNQPRTLAWEPLDSEHVLACARAPYSKVQALIERAGKGKWVTTLSTAAVHDCCKNPENLDIEAWFSRQVEADKGTPDVYKFHCRVCESIHNSYDSGRGYCHAFFCIGGNHPDAAKHSRAERPELFDIRPFWEIR